jgi:hypothetical protein
METTLTPAPSTARLAVKWGLIATLGLIIYSLIIQLTGLIGNSTVNNLSLPIQIAILCGCMSPGMMEYKKAHSGFMSYGQGLGLGTMLSAVAGLLSSAFGAAYIAFVDNSSLRIIREKAAEQWEAQGLSDAQIEQASAMMDKFMSPGVLFITATLSLIFFGFIASLILAAIQRKNKPAFE